MDSVLPGMDIFAEGSLRHVNWANLFLAGGSVIACLSMTKGEAEEESVARMRGRFRTGAYIEADINLFVYSTPVEGFGV
jgi:hypothetical protein